MRKKIFTVIFCFIMIFGMFGCSNKDNDKVGSDNTDNKNNSDAVVDKDFFKNGLEAFRKYYSEFYVEHRDTELTLEDSNECYDCQARISMDDKNNLYMAVCDLVVGSEYDERGELLKQVDLYLFEYNGKEVEMYAKINGAKFDSGDSIIIKCIEGNIYVGDMESCYRVQDGIFIPLERAYYESEDLEKIEEWTKIYTGWGENVNVEGINDFTRFNTSLGEDGLGASFMMSGKMSEGMSDGIFPKGVYNSSNVNMSGNNFEIFLTELMEEDIKSSLDLEFYYSNYYMKKGIIGKERNNVWLWKDGITYSLYQDGTAIVKCIDSGYKTVSVPENIMGYEVKSLGCSKEWLVACFVPDINTVTLLPKNITSIGIGGGLGAFVIPDGTQRLVSAENSDSYYGDDNLEPFTISIGLDEESALQVQIPSSVTEIDKDIFDGIAHTIFCNEGSYAHQYAKENGIPYVIGTLEKNKNDTPIYPSSYRIKKDVLPAYQEYINNQDDFEGCALIYVNGDDIPELYCKTSYGKSIVSYCSNTGKVEALSGGYATTYSYKEKEGIVFDYLGMHETAPRAYYKLADDGSKFEVISKAEAIYNSSENRYEDCEIDGVAVDEQAFKDYENKYGELTNMPSTLYKTVNEAYENIGTSSVTSEKKNIPVSSQSYNIEQEVLPAYQKYIDANEMNGVRRYYSLIYLNDDEVPECILVDSMESNSVVPASDSIYLLSYINGSIVEKEMSLALSNFQYTPKKEYLCAFEYINAEASAYGFSSKTYEIVKFNSSFEDVGKASYSNYLANNDFNKPAGTESYVNGTPVDSLASVETYIQSFSLSDTINKSDLYASLDEAYKNLK